MDEDRPAITVTGNTPLAEFLYPAPAARHTGAIIGWWEKRRLPFNLIVGGSGLVSLALLALSSTPGPGAQIWIPIAAYGLLANICYSLGAAVEITAEKLWGRRMLPLGPTLFRNGIVLSVGVTLVIPVIIVTLSWIARFMGWILT